jgi:hypothetical protein
MPDAARDADGILVDLRVAATGLWDLTLEVNRQLQDLAGRPPIPPSEREG